MKKLSLQIACALTLSLFAMNGAFAQTEVFDQDVSGVHAYTGLKWNSKITQPLLGVEYTIESRTSLGIQMGMPLSDTMFSTPDSSLNASKVHSYFLNPYAEFEFLESDANNKLSVSLKAEYIFESAPSDSGRNNYRRHSFGIGPVLGYRIHAKENIDIVPQLSYEFFYTKWKRNWIGAAYMDSSKVPPSVAYKPGKFDDDYFLQHDITLSAKILYRLNEVQGLTLDPRIVLKLGEGHQDSDLLNIDLRIGYYRSF